MSFSDMIRKKFFFPKLSSEISNMSKRQTGILSLNIRIPLKNLEFPNIFTPWLFLAEVGENEKAIHSFIWENSKHFILYLKKLTPPASSKISHIRVYDRGK